MREGSSDLIVLKCNMDNIIENPIYLLPKYSLWINNTVMYPCAIYPSKYGVNNIIASAQTRVSTMMPDPDNQSIINFKRFSRVYLKLLCDKMMNINESVYYTPEENIDMTSYSSQEKARLRKALQDYTITSKRDLDIGCFVKWEGFESYKTARLINSTSDASKLYLMPIIRSAADRFFHGNPYTIKGLDPKVLPRKLVQMFKHHKLILTDYTSMESHFTGVNVDNFYFVVKYLLRDIWGLYSPAQKLFLHTMLYHNNIMKSRNVSMLCYQRLMSGAPWTSFANCVENLSYTAFLTYCCDDKLKSMSMKEAASALLMNGSDGFPLYPMLCEGDDGVCIDRGQTTEMAGKLGARLKIVHVPNVSHTQFCSLIFSDGSDLILRDALKIFRKFFILDYKYKNAREAKILTLYRAKALSYLYCSPGCPILTAFCLMICRWTKSVDARQIKLDRDELTHYKDMAIKDKLWQLSPIIQECDRDKYYRIFSISPPEQIRLENIFNNSYKIERLNIGDIEYPDYLINFYDLIMRSDQRTEIENHIRPIYSSKIKDTLSHKHKNKSGQKVRRHYINAHLSFI